MTAGPLTSSVVVPFRDWGLDRLRTCLLSVQVASEEAAVETIVSDYGSLDGDGVRAVAERSGATYVRTDADGWSRSRALNAGFAVAVGDVLVSTDADMLFRPGTFDVVRSRLSSHPLETLVLQCRDLPPPYDHEAVDPTDADWEELDALSQLRPRWGMGGFVAQRRETLSLVRGYDERMHTYGGEDVDFVLRLRRAGSRIHWLDHPRARIYHMWHASTAASVDRDPRVQAAVEHNRGIHRSDRTVLRNVTGPHLLGRAAAPACSVLVPDARNARADELESLLAQSVDDLEVLLADPEPALLDTLDDPRVRAVDCGAVGSGTLGRLVAEARSFYSIVHRAGGVHAITRLERLLAAADDSAVAVADGAARVREPSTSRDRLEAVSALDADASACLLWQTRVLRGLSTALGQGGDGQRLLLGLLATGGRVTSTDRAGRLLRDDPSTAHWSARPSAGHRWLQAAAGGEEHGWLTRPPSMTGDVDDLVLHGWASEGPQRLLLETAADVSDIVAAVTGSRPLPVAQVATTDGIVLSQAFELETDGATVRRLLRRLSVSGHRAAPSGLLPADHALSDQAALGHVVEGLVVRYCDLYFPGRRGFGWVVAQVPPHAETSELTARLAAVLPEAHVLVRDVSSSKATARVLLVGGVTYDRLLAALDTTSHAVPAASQVRVLSPSPVSWTQLGAHRTRMTRD